MFLVQHLQQGAICTIYAEDREFEAIARRPIEFIKDDFSSKMTTIFVIQRQ